LVISPTQQFSKTISTIIQLGDKAMSKLSKPRAKQPVIKLSCKCQAFTFPLRRTNELGINQEQKLHFIGLSRLLGLLISIEA